MSKSFIKRIVKRFTKYSDQGQWNFVTLECGHELRESGVNMIARYCHQCAIKNKGKTNVASHKEGS